MYFQPCFNVIASWRCLMVTWPTYPASSKRSVSVWFKFWYHFFLDKSHRCLKLYISRRPLHGNINASCNMYPQLIFVWLEKVPMWCIMFIQCLFTRIDNVLLGFHLTLRDTSCSSVWSVISAWNSYHTNMCTVAEGDVVWLFKLYGMPTYWFIKFSSE